jgi:guanosine-diphosphatase
MRRTSVSLPTKHVARDPHEKPDRYDLEHGHEPGLLARMQSAWLSQSQRARWIKTGAIVFVVFLVFYYFSPSGVDIYHGGGGMSRPPGAAPLDRAP